VGKSADKLIIDYKIVNDYAKGKTLHQ